MLPLLTNEVNSAESNTRGRATGIPAFDPNVDQWKAKAESFCNTKRHAPSGEEYTRVGTESSSTVAGLKEYHYQ
jgi:hypothetical protein